MGKYQLTKVLIFCQKDSLLTHRKSYHLHILCPRRNTRNRKDIITACPKGPYHTLVAAFIRKKAHDYLLAARLGGVRIIVSSWANASAAYRMAAWISSLVSLG